MATEIKQGFEKMLVELSIAELRRTKQVSPNVRKGHKYMQILASIREVGLIEPPVVSLCKSSGEYLLLDGHLRTMALGELGEERVSCLVSVDDEGYTYNKFINRLSAVQEHKMIVKALKAGVSEEKLAAALHLDAVTIRFKSKLLDGICADAVNLLRVKTVSGKVFALLRKMKPVRQIRVAMLMNDQNRYSYMFVQKLLEGTSQEQLADNIRGVRPSRAALEKRMRLEEESVALGEDVKTLRDSYGVAMLNLTAIQAYLKRMMHNEQVLQYLHTYHPDIYENFAEIIKISFLRLKPESGQEPSTVEQ